MADRYVRSGAGGAGTGADWANAHTTFTAAITAGAAGDVYYVAADHAESGATVTLGFKGTDAAPDKIYCAIHTGTVPPVAADLRTTAVVEATGALTVTGVISLCYGVIFRAGVGGSTTLNLSLGASSQEETFKNCQFKLSSTGVSSRLIPVATTSGICNWEGCTAEFSATAQGFATGGVFRWYDKAAATAIAGATLPTVLMVGSAVAVNDWQLSGLDLSVLGSGKTLVASAAQVGGKITIVNCGLGSSVTVAVTPTSRSRLGVDMIASDSAAISARGERYRYQGTLTTETTIVRTGGATDGTTPFSWKVVTTTNVRREDPFECFEGAIWNATTGASKTLTIHIVTDNVTLTDAEIWVEADYLSSASVPIVTTISDAPATVLTAGANQAASTETWTTTGLTTPVKQKLEATFTPLMVGFVRFRVKVAKASTTVYIDPPDENSIA